jgi:hypothetical protein
VPASRRPFGFWAALLMATYSNTSRGWSAAPARTTRMWGAKLHRAIGQAARASRSPAGRPDDTIIPFRANVGEPRLGRRGAGRPRGQLAAITRPAL